MTLTRTPPAQAATVTAVAYLARQIAPGYFDILFIARDAGPAAAARAYVAGSHCVGGQEADGQFRRWSVDGRNIWFRAGDADSVVVPLREVFAWALARISPSCWATLQELRDTREAALHAEYGDRDLTHRETYRPHDVTAAERALLAAARARRHEADAAARDLVARALTDETPAGQLGLFDLEVTAS